MDELRRRWKNLRDGMNRCLKKINDNQKSGAAASKAPTCKLFQQLLFLKDTLQHRDATVSNFNIASQDVSLNSLLATADDTASIIQEFEPLSPPAMPMVNLNTSLPTPPVTKTSVKRKSSSDVDMLLMKALSDSTPKHETTTTSESSDMLFCRSIVEILERLPPRKNRLARMEIQRVLLNYEFDED